MDFLLKNIKKYSWKKWFRKPAKEMSKMKNGICARKDIVIGKIPKCDLVTAVKHFAKMVTNQGHYVDLQTLDHCPDILRDCVVLVMGNDSGQGYCREAVRFVNRKHGNHGGKMFVTALMQGTDKSLSLFQKQALFSSLSALRNLHTIDMGGKERKLIKISAMDYEAAHEDVGTQVK